jgi:hypothetical protein
MHGMILDDVKGQHAEGPGSGHLEYQTTDALENHCGGNVTVGSNPTPSA